MSETGLKTTVTNAADSFMKLFEGQIEESRIELSDYARQCAYSTVFSVNRLLLDNGLSWKEMDSSNVIDIITTVAGLELNPNATPREVYFQIRKKRVKQVDSNSGKSTEVWKNMIEVGIEGDGNDAILSRFGRGVKTVHRFWIVRENDSFTYPNRNGLEIIPPTWEPKGAGKCIRVVYPVTFNDGQTEYYICERDEVLNNLMAHISNNMMNETFGICPNRYNATEGQKAEIAMKKREYLKKAAEKGFDVLDDPEFEPWISSAWRSEYSREQMIIRKMRNNIVKKIPKDFSIQQGALAFSESEGEAYSSPKANVIDVDFEEVGITQNADEKKALERLNGEVVSNDADAG